MSSDKASRVGIGVRLPEPSGEPGPWLNAAAAYDAAGADVLWLDLRGSADVDPVAVTAALAAVTHRSLVVAALPDEARGAVTLDTLARLARGRLRIAADAEYTFAEPGAKDAEPGAKDAEPGAEEDAKPGAKEDTEPGAEEDAKPGAKEDTEPGAKDTEPGAKDDAEPGGEDAVSGGDDGAGTGVWRPVEFPDDRAAWRAALAEAAEAGAPGLLLAADPRLLDLLRNPDEEGDRRDLQLAQG